MYNPLRLLTLYLALLCHALPSHAQDLLIAFEPSHSEPYVIMNGNELANSLTKSLGDAIAQAAGMTAVYQITSRARIEKDTELGIVHMNCLTTPQWFKNPQSVLWSVPLLNEEERYLLPHEAADIVTQIDLDGRSIGLIRNYRYPSLEEGLATGRFTRDDSMNVQQAYRKLKRGRIDAMLAKDIQINYLMKNDPTARQFKLATRVESRNTLLCAISRNLPYSATRLEQAFQKLKVTGQLERIANEYR